MNRYVALLRGINLGKRQIKMAELRQVLEEADYANVQTLLASGNVIVETDEKDGNKVSQHLEKVIAERFGFEVPVILRTKSEIDALVKADPFKGIEVTKDTRLYVTFLKEPVKSQLKLPFSAEGGALRILEATPKYVTSVVQVQPGRGTLDLMDIVGKEYGAGHTMRNWNTVIKIHTKMQAG